MKFVPNCWAFTLVEVLNPCWVAKCCILSEKLFDGCWLATGCWDVTIGCCIDEVLKLLVIIGCIGIVLVANNPCKVEKLLGLIYCSTDLVLVLNPMLRLRLTGWLTVCVFHVCGGIYCWFLVGLELVLNDIGWLGLLLKLFEVFWLVANIYLMVLKSDGLLFSLILKLTFPTTGTIGWIIVCVFIPEKKSICGYCWIIDVLFLLVYSSALLKKSTSLLSITTDCLGWLFMFIVWNINCIVLNYYCAFDVGGCVAIIGVFCIYASKSNIFCSDCLLTWVILDSYNKLLDVFLTGNAYYTLELDAVDTDWP